MGGFYPFPGVAVAGQAVVCSCSAFLALCGCAAGFRPPRRRPSYLSLRVQRKVTERKDTPIDPSFGHPVLRAREPMPGFADSTSCAATNTRTSVSASLRADPSPAHRVSRGPGKAARILRARSRAARVKTGAHRCPEISVRHRRACSCYCICGQEGRCCCGAPLGAAGGGRFRRGAAASGGTDAADRSAGTRMCRRAGPNAARVPEGHDARRARPPGGPFLGYFLWTSKESDSHAARRAKPRDQPTKGEKSRTALQECNERKPQSRCRSLQSAPTRFRHAPKTREPGYPPSEPQQNQCASAD